MIRYLPGIFAMSLLLAFTLQGEAVAQSSVFLKDDKKAGASSKPIFNAPQSQNTGVYKPPGGGTAPGGYDYMSQMLQENDAADFEIIKDESLKIKDQVMQDRAVRAAVQAELEKQEAAEAGLFMNPGAAANAQKKEEEEAGEKKKKVYVRKSGLETPKKVFNSDE